MSAVIDEHRLYLSDQPRLSAFRQAINEVVKPGDVVLDLGAGSGIMGLLSCSAGAKRVYSIDESGMIGIARALARANGFHDRIIFIKGFSTQVDLPEKVDVVVADQIGRFGFEAGVLDFFYDAHQRFLKPGGRLIPSRIHLEMAPVEHAEMFQQVDFWSGTSFGFQLHPVRSQAANTGYPVKYQPENILSTPVIGASRDCATAGGTPFHANADFEISKAGTLHGIGGWFSAQLSDNVTLTNSPLSPARINRHNVYLPIEQPVAVGVGDRVLVKMHIMPSDTLVTWDVEVRTKQQPDKCKARFLHSTFRGMLINKESLDATHPTRKPKLTPRGVARQSVLELCDGQRTLAEIEAEVGKRHPELLRSASEVSYFVSEVVSRYTK